MGEPENGRRSGIEGTVGTRESEKRRVREKEGSRPCERQNGRTGEREKERDRNRGNDRMGESASGRKRGIETVDRRMAERNR